ncbi:MAG: ornithine cyclodeaminase family protein [Bacillota bacterium]
MPDATIRFLQQEDVIDAGVLNMKETIADIEEVLTLLSNGHVLNPAKTSIQVPSDDDPQGWRFFNSMPTYVGGNIRRAGVKWACEHGKNVGRGIPMGIDILVLSDPDTVLPVAVMDATLITAMRTAANAGVAVKYLANPSSEDFAVLGAGVIGRTLLMALNELDFDYHEIRLYDLLRDKASALAEEFPSLPVVVTDSGEEAIRGADVAITATTAHRPIVQEEWLDRHTLLVQLSKNEFPRQTVLDVDVISVDDWDQMITKSGSSFQEHYEEGRLTRDDVVILSDVVAGNTPGRTDEGQRIMHFSRGLGCQDVMIGERIYRRALESDMGKIVRLWDSPKWV